MINNILTYSDFREIAEHCKHCLGGLGIRDFIKDIFREFGKSNTNLALSMMEYLEQNYQPIEGIEGLIDHEYDILNFRDEVPEIENASIEYLYMLLNDIAEKRTIEVKSRDVEKMYIKAKYDINKLNRILTNLKSQNFCEFTDVSKVNWIFLEKEQGPDDEKIR